MEEQATVIPAHLVHRTPEYRKLRAEYTQLKKEVRPPPNDDDNRKLRKELREAQNELRQAEKELKARELESDLRLWVNERVALLDRLLDDFAPPEERSNPAFMAQWHTHEAFAWASMLDDSPEARLHDLVEKFAAGDLPRWWKAKKREGAYVPAALRRKILAGGECVECHSSSNLTIDHIWPVALGGRSTEANLQVLCQKCNSRKHMRVPVA